MPAGDNDSLLLLAKALSDTDPVLLLGMVPIPEGENLSASAGIARDLRKLIQNNIDRVNLRAKARIRVTYNPWDDIRFIIAEEESIRLLVLDWPHHLESLKLTAAEILSHPPCDVAIFRGPLKSTIKKIGVYNRGGPHAERALELGLNAAQHFESQVTSLNLRAQEETETSDRYFLGMDQILSEMPDVEQIQIDVESREHSAKILDLSADYDLITLGTVAFPPEISTSFGLISDTLLKQCPSAVLTVKTKRVVPESAEHGEFGARAISVLVDRWFAENTFHADEFADLNRLLDLKIERGVKISVALPALNEEQTIGEVIHTLQRSLVQQVPLVDEIILLDSNSHDRTREIAQEAGIPVFIHQEILPLYKPIKGKGEALWKSLYVTEGDLVIWVDTDIRNFHPRFVYGIIGPLLQRTSLKLVKGFYRRPLRTSTGLKPGRGGRVTELTARPLLNLMYPGLSGIIQPLSGEYGGRREALEQMVFTSGYGVETSLLIEAFERFKLSSIAQVDLVERIHRNQDLTNLGKMSFAIIQTVFAKLEKRYGREMLNDVNRTMKMIRYEAGTYRLEVEEIGEYERPPMITVPEYRAKRGLPPLGPSETAQA
jgi:glucosyl-3-phosphoglycerate synthase